MLISLQETYHLTDFLPYYRMLLNVEEISIQKVNI